MNTLQSSGHAPINGINMYYEIHGEGSIPLVLIHGGGSTIETNFSAIIPILSKKNKLIAVELQAHGRTSDRDTPESFEQDADDVIGLLKYLKIDKANFFGFSNGGTTTLRIAIKYPEMVNKIIVASGAVKREGFINGFFEFMPNATLNDMPMPLQEGYLKLTPDRNGLLAMFTKDRDRMVGFTDWPDEELKSIKAPSMFMVADHDVITVEHTLDMSRLISNAPLAVLPGAHGTYIGEVCSMKEGSTQPLVTCILIEEFLNG